LGIKLRRSGLFVELNPGNKFKLRRSGLFYSRCVQSIGWVAITWTRVLSMDLGICVGYEQAAPPELDFNDIIFLQTGHPYRGYCTPPTIF
jgi:hypothetical protein